MSDTYVEEREGVTYVRGSRVPLESLVVPWREGHSAEDIRAAYSTLTRAEVCGAIAYYLDHQSLLDQQLAAGAAQYEAQRQAAEKAEPARYAALRQRLGEQHVRRGAQSPAS